MMVFRLVTIRYKHDIIVSLEAKPEAGQALQGIGAAERRIEPTMLYRLIGATISAMNR
jgi:hypothetical protein